MSAKTPFTQQERVRLFFLLRDLLPPPRPHEMGGETGGEEMWALQNLLQRALGRMEIGSGDGIDAMLNDFITRASEEDLLTMLELVPVARSIGIQKRRSPFERFGQSDYFQMTQHINDFLDRIGSKAHFGPNGKFMREESAGETSAEPETPSDKRESTSDITSFDWQKLDQRLLSIRLTELSEEMQQSTASQEHQVQHRAAQSGNGAAFFPMLSEMHERLADLWAEKNYKVHCDVWEKQGNRLTGSFIRAVRDKAVLPLLSARQNTVAWELRRRDQLTGRTFPNADPVISEWERKLQRLSAKWSRKLEAEAIERDYSIRSSPVARFEVPDGMDSPTVKVPSAFISYSWESEEHKNWVREFATRLRGDGIDVTLDQWALRVGMDRNLFMENGVAENNFVIVVCTPTYSTKANQRKGGAGYEAMIITGELAEKIETRKFVPVLRLGNWESSVPRWLKTKLGVDLRGQKYSSVQYEALLRDLHNEQAAPPIGVKPNWKASDQYTSDVDSADDALRLAKGLVIEGGTPLSAEKDGNNLAISVASFRAHYNDTDTAVSYNSGSIHLLSRGETWYVFADDPERKGGPLTYQATAKRSTGLTGPTRLYIGSIRVP